MHYLHTMVRIRDIDESLKFYCDGLGLEESYRKESEKGRYTLIFLNAPGDKDRVDENKAPMVELTYNWPDEDGNTEDYGGGRNFGHLAYRVDDVYATCQRLMDMGVTINRPPRDGYMAFVRSPDGISFELLNDGGPQEPQEPWASMENTGSW